MLGAPLSRGVVIRQQRRKLVPTPFMFVVQPNLAFLGQRIQLPAASDVSRGGDLNDFRSPLFILMFSANIERRPALPTRSKQGPACRVSYTRVSVAAGVV
jgi:hypothetical protein